MNWTRIKPTLPGVYNTRWHQGAGVHRVTVHRIGRGLRVTPHGPWRAEPMSALGDTELEWRLVTGKGRAKK